MKTTCLALCSALFFNFASAEETAHEKAASTLLEAMNVKQEMENNFAASIEPMVQPMILQMGLDEAQSTELKDIFLNWWKNDIDQDKIVSQFRGIYMESFTTEELEELATFYETPLGTKVLAVMPELTQQGMQIGMEAAGEKEELLTTRIDAFMEKVMEEEAPAEETAPEEDAAEIEAELAPAGE